MDALGNFLIGLPPPFGVVVTGLLPLLAIGAGFGALGAHRRQRRHWAATLVAVALIALFGAAAFLWVAARS